MKNIQKIEITTRTLLIAFAIPIILFAIWHLRTLFFMFFISFIFASALRPLVDILHKRRIPRLVSILLIYLGIFLFLSFVLYISGIAIFDQIERLGNNASGIVYDTLSKLFDSFPWLKDIFGIQTSADLRQQVELFFSTSIPSFLKGSVFTSHTGETIISTVGDVVSFLFGSFTVIVLSVYMIVRDEKFYLGFIQFVEKTKQEKFIKVFNKVESQLGNWLLGQFMLMLIIGLMSYLGLKIPELFFPDNVFSQYAIPLSLIAGLLEVVPNLGPVFTWVLAIIITIGSGGTVIEVGYIAFLFTAIQQLEGIFLVPVVMKKAIGIDPIVVILGVIAASSLFGIIGAILILPIIATFQIIFDELFRKEA